MQTPWESEEGKQARTWLRPLVVTRLQWLGRGRAVLPAELEVVCCTSRHPRCTPGFVTWPLCVRRVPLCFQPVHMFCVPTLCVSGADCPGSPAVLLLPQSIALVTTRVMFGNVLSAFGADVHLLWRLLGLVSSVTSSKGDGTQVLLVPSLLLWFRTLQKPLAALFSCMLLDIYSEVSQAEAFPKSSQALGRK